MALTIFFDLSGIAAIGAVFYLIMNIIIRVGILRYLEDKVKANPQIVIAAIVLDSIVLVGFIWVKSQTNLRVTIVSAVMIAVTFFGERISLKRNKTEAENEHRHTEHE